jgi:hypothetical protein
MEIRGSDLREVSPVVDLIIQSRHKKSAKHYLQLQQTLRVLVLYRYGTVSFRKRRKCSRTRLKLKLWNFVVPGTVQIQIQICSDD